MTRREMKSSIAVVVIIASFWLQGSHSILLENNCGVDSGRVIENGKNAGLTNNPWIAYLHKREQFKCAGSLVNHWFVLTAAHCLPDDGDIKVRLGEYNSKTKVDCVEHTCLKPAQDYDVDMIFKHSSFDANNHANDIGMLRLEKRVEYQTNILPVCIFVSFTESLKKSLDAVLWFKASGWGNSAGDTNGTVLQEQDILRHKSTACSELFGKDLASDQICASMDNGALCDGDSGGPHIRVMRYGQEFRRVQLAITSRTNAECKGSTILTDLSSHADWIKRVVHRFGPLADKQWPDNGVKIEPTFV
ncbi:CLIP domain-containing serine protease B9-like [Drosophila rhopaloa]|uniref:Chymotrypsin-like protease CTRL-1 n=1 Tax=Drosophila rhopaloa TaxID=1041015 RepID=A0A6P4F4R1_DRORH|nr:CLIP domain-containing serine protease B9-like [Drosophila rhopaloa]